jgi:hypothetical protein
MFQTKVAVNPTTHILYSITFFLLRTFRLANDVQKYGTARQAAGATCVPDNRGIYKKTQSEYFHSNYGYANATKYYVKRILPDLILPPTHLRKEIRVRFMQWRTDVLTKLSRIPSSVEKYIEKNKIGGDVASVGEWSSAYRVLVGKPEENIPQGRTRRRWEENIKTVLQEVRA